MRYVTLIKNILLELFLRRMWNDGVFIMDCMLQNLREMLHRSCVDDGVDGHRDDVTVTSPVVSSTESSVSAAVSLEPANRIAARRWLLVDKRPDVCCWVDDNMASLADVDGFRRTMGVCGESQQQQQQQRQPLTVLFGTAMTSTVTVPARPSPAAAVAVAAPPWRPFSVHEDRPSSPAAPRTSAELRGSTVAAAESTVEEVVDQTAPQHHAAPQQYAGTDFLPVIPFVPVLPDALFSHLAIDRLRHQHLLSSVHQQVITLSYLLCFLIVSS